MSNSSFTERIRAMVQVAFREARRWTSVRWQRLLEWVGWREVPLRAERAAEVPLDVESDRVYLVGKGEHLWQAVFKCPCECGADVQLPLMPEGRPRWDVTVHPGGAVSLRPSVDRTVGCRSHFFVRRGRIEWAEGSRMRNVGAE